MRAERHSDEATDTDGGERERTKRFNKKKFENEARITSDEISESETSAVEQGISKISSRAKSEKITRRSHPIKTRIRFNETKDIHENSVRETNFNERNGSRTYPTTKTTTRLIVNDTEENIVKHAKSTNSSKRQQ